MTATPPIALTIAGSDSGGGAGIQADLKTFQAFGCFGTSAITAITVQNTLGVSGVHSIPVDTVQAQIRAVADDLPPAACKTGMLATSELVRAVAESIRVNRLPNFVLDPVMVASSGDRLLDEDAQRTIVEHLLPLAALVTPNLDEAALLVGFPVDDPEAMRRAAVRLVELGAKAALLKGGHLRSEELVDLLWDGREWREWRRPRLDTRSTHGTGCTLSAGIAAGLAHGRPLDRAVEDALDFVQRAMQSAPGLGAGHGPLNHLVPGPA
ncbi:bifunctional hydroxymethylpyrimidine kinase/phosphomethylpyrimidine kinase [Longimicrobium terrae]|uniref:hydroxymethylpyrimidine kinase n=1 Tax=Longimicrobium terrae TaxID=1639882 RepID=A0A841H1L4_9BACT|nr:bifunctional hydroxymethylpyrimidine kinase/phosphomethylpyrimidine kinase [Longimicrobium terrae]MBB4637618.1 hydroxymethylpyrimidine/phosphomethylpyrimidine kinase [Longimicrobium terrae]MBB6072015.1 hydroxymethylpyrimidine/phosphomethylpyrimidine kinase [Longimicrobium terrae]